MQHLRSEIRQLRRFIKADHLDAPCIFANSWIGGENSIHVSPDFNSLGAQSGAYDGSRKIRAAASDRRRDSCAVCSYKPTHHWNLAGIQQRPHFALQPLIRFFGLRNRLHVTAVGYQHFTRVHVSTVQSVRRKRRRHDFAGKNLAERRHMVGGPRR